MEKLIVNEELEKAKELIRIEEQKKLQQFNEKINELCKEYGYTLEVSSSIICKKIEQ
jgi:hypothetical protein